MRPIVKLSQGRIVYSLDDSMAIIRVRAWDGVSSAVLSKTVVLRRGGFASMLIVPRCSGSRDRVWAGLVSIVVCVCLRWMCGSVGPGDWSGWMRGCGRMVVVGRCV